MDDAVMRTLLIAATIIVPVLIAITVFAMLIVGEDAE
jgi:hypothetical protein